MSRLTEDNTRFKEHMGGFFHDLLRAAGITMTPGNTPQRLREIGERVATSIEHAAERKSIQVIQKLQAAVSDAFDKMEAELNKVKGLLSNHNELIGTLLAEHKGQAESIRHLQEEMGRLKRQRPIG